MPPTDITVHEAQTLLSHVKREHMDPLYSLALRQSARVVNQENTVERMDLTRHLATVQRASFADSMPLLMNLQMVLLVSNSCI